MTRPERQERAEARATNGTATLIDADLEPLHRRVARALERYLTDHEGESHTDLYALVLREVERPMLQCVMTHVAGNQSRAADVLGLNRGTLRKKLKTHGLLEE
jgi:Fis family transcriptional regulator